MQPYEGSAVVHIEAKFGRKGAGRIDLRAAGTVLALADLRTAAAQPTRLAVSVVLRVQRRAEGVPVRLHQVDFVAADAADTICVAVVVVTAVSRLRVLRHTDEIHGRVASAICTGQINLD